MPYLCYIILLKIVTKKRCTVVMVFCRLCHDDDQNKRKYHLHVCGGDIDVLTWGDADP